MEESLTLPEVLAGADAAGLALVCEAPLAAAGGFCAITGTPNVTASRMAVIDPGVATLLFTLVPFGPKTLYRNDGAHRSLLDLSMHIASYWPNGNTGAKTFVSLTFYNGYGRHGWGFEEWVYRFATV